MAVFGFGRKTRTHNVSDTPSTSTRHGSLSFSLKKLRPKLQFTKAIWRGFRIWGGTFFFFFFGGGGGGVCLLRGFCSICGYKRGYPGYPPILEIPFAEVASYRGAPAKV